MNNSRFTVGLAAMLIISTASFASEDTITLPAGSELHVQLITTLSPKDNDTGDFWTSKVVEPIFGKGGEIVPEGSTVDGHITFVKSPGQTKGKGEMRLIADSITTPDGSKYNLITSLQNPQLPKTTDDEGTGVMAALAHKFHKKGKDTVPTQGTEMTFAISRDTTAKKVPSKQ
jgi:hypothetical protein